MTNKIAIVLGLVILGLFALDYFIIGADSHIFLGRKLGELIEYMDFWR